MRLLHDTFGSVVDNICTNIYILYKKLFTLWAIKVNEMEMVSLR